MDFSEINGNNCLHQKQLEDTNWTESELNNADGQTIHDLFSQGIGLTYNDFSMFIY